MKTNILEYLEQTVSKIPGKTAFSDGTDSVTFSQLYNMSRAGGSKLCRMGCRREPVMVIMDKHPNEIVAFCSVIYAGCFYVPIDAEMPKKRIEVIAENLKPRFVVCDDRNLSLAESLDIESIITFNKLIDSDTDDILLSDVRANQIDTDPIYVVFTSGSTGIPKGVIACHRSVIDYTEHLCEALHFSENNIFGNQTPLYFDAPLKEIMPTLKFGATTFFIPKKLFMFPVKLVEYLNKYKINTVCWVVSALTMISALGAFKTVIPEYLHTVAFGSEVFPIKQLNIWRSALPKADFYNLYGPTEATGMSCYWHMDRELDEGETVPIGRAFHNTRIILINDKGVLAKKGEQGEIYIGGTCVTMGYYANASKTDESYVQNPLVSSYRDIVYKTGDIGQYNDRGELVFISRKDHQIKHMGHRIELGEIEAATDSIDTVARSCCIYDTEKKKIRLFYMGSADEKEVLSYLKNYLPRYMIPSSVLHLNELPLTPNGKLDRRKLSSMINDV